MQNLSKFVETLKKLKMKKITLLAAVVIAASFASCKKNYTCSCTWNDDGTSAGSYTYNNTKKKAKDACEANNTGIITCKIN